LLPIGNILQTNKLFCNIFHINIHDSIAIVFPDSIVVLFPDCIAVAFPDSIVEAIPDSIAVAIPDSIAVAIPDSIAVAILRHAHQYHRDRLFVMHINIIGTGSTIVKFIRGHKSHSMPVTFKFNPKL
jgi:hypothetical protein